MTATSLLLGLIGDRSIKVVIYGCDGMESDNQLPIEKQFTHMMFCQQIQNIDLDTAKQLLVQLHLLYLGQQAVMVKMGKGSFFGDLK